MDKYSEFLEDWKDFNGATLKEEFCLDQIKILSVDRIECDSATFWIIDPMELGFPLPKFRRCIKRGLSDLELRLLDETGIALFIEDLKKIYYLDPEVYKSFGDMFGLKCEACDPNYFRDLHLAWLFKKIGFAFLTVRKKSKTNVVYAFHKSDLGGLEFDLKQIVDFYKGNGAVVFDYSFNERAIQVCLEFPVKKQEWSLCLVLRDSDVGRESLSIYGGWKKGESILYTTEFKRRHRTPTTWERMSNELSQIIDKTNDTYRGEEVPLFMVENTAKTILGKKQFSRFKFHMINHSEENPLTAAANFDTAKEEQQIQFRLSLGNLMKGAQKNA